MKKLLYRNWWVLAFAVCTYALFEQASYKIVNATQKLEKRVEELKHLISSREQEQEELKAIVSSQNDPAWIELSLIKGLGMVPEGYTKIYIEDDSK